MDLSYFTARFRAGDDLSPEDAAACFDLLQNEREEQPIADALTAWSEKGCTSEELFAVASILKKRCRRVNSIHSVFVDAVGTGGSKAKTFNVSTAAAFVIAGAGIPVAKHGNRAATSSSGSADVLAELGFEIDQSAELAETCLNELGICFMFAPAFHSLSPLVGKVRRRLGFPTIFNGLGPLCNPARAPFQLIGASSAELQTKMAEALHRLGTTRSWVVHGTEGLDEISISGPTSVAEVSPDGVSYSELYPEDFGIGSCPTNGLDKMPPDRSAQLIRQILAGRNDVPGAMDIVLINAAAAIYLAGGASSKPEAAEIARDSIRSGSASKKLEELCERTRR
jgi:anthranilate phosphoribosyltransferase